VTSFAPGQELTFEEQRVFFQVGGGYFAQITLTTLEDNWYQLGTRLDFSVGAGLEVSRSLVLAPELPLAGQPVNASFTIRNAADRPLMIQRLGAVARGPNCGDWGCEGWGDFPAVTGIVLAPGESYDYNASRVFNLLGGGYFAEPAFEGPNGWWYPLQGGNRLDFSVILDVPVQQYLPVMIH
jgi:hypothetical protein